MGPAYHKGFPGITPDFGLTKSFFLCPKTWEKIPLTDRPTGPVTPFQSRQWHPLQAAIVLVLSSKCLMAGLPTPALLTYLPQK